MYEQLLEDDGYTVETKLVDSRDAYMPTFPDERRHRPGIRRRHRQLPQHPGRTAPTPSPSRPATASSSPPTARPCSRRPASRCSTSRRPTDTNAFFVTPGVQRGRGRHRRSPTSRASRSPWRRRPDCEGRLDCERRALRRVRHRRHRGAAARLRLRPDLPVGARRRVRARRDQHHRRHARVPGPAWSSRTTSRSSRRRTSCPAVVADFLAEQPRRRRHPQPADGGADHRDARPSSTAGSPSTARRPRTWRRLPHEQGLL